MLVNPLGFSTDKPCPRQLLGKDLCGREHYAAWWELALEQRRAVIEAIGNADDFSKATEAQRAATLGWLKKWAADDASTMDKGLAISKAAPNIERRFETPTELGVFDADDADLSTFGLVFRDETDDLVRYVVEGESVIAALGKAGIVVESVVLDEARKRSEKGGAASSTNTLLWVGVAVVVGVGAYLYLSDGGEG